MTLTTLCLSLIYPTLLFIGLLVIAHITRTPKLDTIDFFAFLFSLALLMTYFSWCVALNYGVEML